MKEVKEGTKHEPFTDPPDPGPRQGPGSWKRPKDAGFTLESTCLDEGSVMESGKTRHQAAVVRMPRGHALKLSLRLGLCCSELSKLIQRSHCEVMDHSGQPCLKPGMEQVWANYITKWIQSYQVPEIAWHISDARYSMYGILTFKTESFSR